MTAGTSLQQELEGSYVRNHGRCGIGRGSGELTRSSVQSECVDDVGLDRLEIQDSARTDECNADVRYNPVDVRACSPAGDQQSDGEKERSRNHRRYRVVVRKTRRRAIHM